MIWAKPAVRPKLAISLNAPNDELRTQLMPINKKWNLEQLMTAAREFPLRNREKLTFEYVLLRNTNDSPQHARELAELVRGMKAKINLIALNPGPGVAFHTPHRRSRAQVSKDPDGSRCTRIYPAAPRPGYLRRLRPVETHPGNDCLGRLAGSVRVGEFGFTPCKTAGKLDLENCSPHFAVTAADFSAMLLDDPVAGT